MDNVSWEDHWKSLKKDKEWSDEVMVQATAWFTEIDIQVVWTTGMAEEPFKTIGGNMDNRAKDCTGLPMWIGYKNSIHYQSLLPNDEEISYPRSCRRKKDKEAQLEWHKTVRSVDKKKLRKKINQDRRKWNKTVRSVDGKKLRKKINQGRKEWNKTVRSVDGKKLRKKINQGRREWNKTVRSVDRKKLRKKINQGRREWNKTVRSVDRKR